MLLAVKTWKKAARAARDSSVATASSTTRAPSASAFSRVNEDQKIGILNVAAPQPQGKNTAAVRTRRQADGWDNSYPHVRYPEGGRSPEGTHGRWTRRLPFACVIHPVCDPQQVGMTQFSEHGLQHNCAFTGSHSSYICKWPSRTAYTRIGAFKRRGALPEPHTDL